MAKTFELTLDDIDSLGVMSSADTASEILGLKNYEEPAVILEVIERFLAVVDSDETKNTLGPTNAALALGSLWGNSLLVAYDWTWIRVSHGDWESLGVVDAKRKIPCDAISNVRETALKVVRSFNGRSVCQVQRNGRE